MKLDKKDMRILYELDYNAKMPLSELAKKVSISKQNLNHRMKRLISNKVIKSFVSVIDTHHLGHLTYRVYFRYKDVDEKREKEIIQYLKENNHTLWIITTSGSWDLEVVFVAKNFIHFNNIFKKIKEEMGENFSKYNISMSIVNYHLKRDYLLNKKRTNLKKNYYGFEPKEEKLDKLDLEILLELSKNCKITNVDLGRKLKTSYQTIKSRINKLGEKGIIQSHRISIDLSKIGRKFYKIIIKLNNISKNKEKEIYNFCSSKNFVAYIVEVLGEWQLEVETEISAEEELENFIRELRNKFSEEILDYNILKAKKEHKLNYLPNGEELIKVN